MLVIRLCCSDLIYITIFGHTYCMNIIFSSKQMSNDLSLVVDEDAIVLFQCYIHNKLWTYLVHIHKLWSKTSVVWIKCRSFIRYENEMSTLMIGLFFRCYIHNNVWTYLFNKHNLSWKQSRMHGV